MEVSAANWKSVTPAFSEAIEAALEPGEIPSTWFEPDLTAELQFAAGVVVLTDRRLLAIGPVPAEDSKPKRAAELRVQAWPLPDISALRVRERGGVGQMDVMGLAGRLATWRFTAGKSSAVHRMVVRFESGQAGGAGQESEPAPTVCPSCGALIPADQTECASCAPSAAPPVVSSLYRLIKFARPRLGMTMLGCLLTVAGTAALLAAKGIRLTAAQDGTPVASPAPEVT